MDALAPEGVLWILTAVALAALIHGALGIGFPMVVTPLIALVIDVQTAIIVSLIPNIGVNILSIHRGGRWRESIGRHWPLAFFMLGGSALGTLVLVNSDPNPLRLVLAGALIFYLSTAWGQSKFSWPLLDRHPRSAAAGAGLLAGLLGGTVNVSGPVMLVYLLQLTLTPLALVQVLNLCFLVGKLSQLATFSLLGQVNSQLLLYSLPLLGLALLFLQLGMQWRDRLAVETYRRWLHRLLAAMAVMLLGQFLLHPTG